MKHGSQPLVEQDEASSLPVMVPVDNGGSYEGNNNAPKADKEHNPLLPRERLEFFATAKLHKTGVITLEDPPKHLNKERKQLDAFTMHKVVDLADHVPPLAFTVLVDETNRKIVMNPESVGDQASSMFQHVLKRNGKYLIQENDFEVFLCNELTSPENQAVFFPPGTEKYAISESGVMKAFKTYVTSIFSTTNTQVKSALKENGVLISSVVQMIQVREDARKAFVQQLLKGDTILIQSNQQYQLANALQQSLFLASTAWQKECSSSDADKDNAGEGYADDSTIVLAAQQQVSRLEAANKTLTEQLEALQAESQQRILNEKNILMEQLEALQAELQRVSDEKKTLVEQLKALQAEKHSVLGKMKAKMEQLEALQAEAHVRDTDEGNADAGGTDNSAIVLALQQQVQALEAELERVQGENETQRSMIESLTEDLEATQVEVSYAYNGIQVRH